MLETEVNGQIVTVDWELEGSAEYFEGETVYKNGKTYSSLTIDAVTDETCGTYICTAMTNEKTFVTKTEVRLSKEKSAEEIEGIGFDFVISKLSPSVTVHNFSAQPSTPEKYLT